MDSVRKAQTSFDYWLIDEMNHSDEVNWVEAAWRLEDVPQDGVEDWMDCAGCVEVNLEVHESLSDPAESAPEILPKGDKKQDNLVATQGELLCLGTQLYRAQNCCQSTSYKDGIIVEERADIRSLVSGKSYKCSLGCNTPAFNWPKDLRRHIKDIHETTARYRMCGSRLRMRRLHSLFSYQAQRQFPSAPPEQTQLSEY
ncbi:hypothetical protein WAI453_004302 [Rhynchosporium graminicola]|uniref:Uncharacterized protein n=1 Tax=Rhynchosporium graminicola TaxID=2792576 RepID=A0A1E1LMT0_9HELO|nr:uncharacterized protein RCO7_11381 [Rhynchosporium commune]